MRDAGLNDSLETNGSPFGNRGDSIGQGLVGVQIGAQFLDALVIEINPNGGLDERERVRSVAISDDLKGVGSGRVGDGLRHRRFRGHNSFASSDAGAVPIVGASIINPAAAGSESNQGIVAVLLCVITT